MSTSTSSIIDATFSPDPAPPVTLVLAVLLLVLFFVGFFSIYFCRCFLENIVDSLNTPQTSNGSPINPIVTPPGLDSIIVNSFPTLTYASVQEYRCEKYGLECAICLCEFEDNDVLRLLTICCHVFHQECIDLWFESHKSCPVCRRNLDVLDAKKSLETDDLPNIESVATTTGVVNNTGEIEINVEESNLTDDNDVVIAIEDENEDQNKKPKNDEHKVMAKKDEGDSCTHTDKFPRSHSTGHSIIRSKAIEDDRKYTLRLPEHIKETIARRHIVTLSCTTFGEYASISTKKHECFGEICNCT
ncbi:unnamed protein product [Amaranthus hypochondriacus]